MYLVLSLLLLAIVGPMLIFAPWVPTRKRDVTRLIALSRLQTGETLYDLGSWDGKVLFAIAGQLDCKLVGVESFLPLYLFSIIKKFLFYRGKNIHFILGNFFNAPLQDADVIYVFGMPGKMDRLEQKLEKECKKGTRVISYTFPMENWKEITRDKPSKEELSMYLYHI